MPKEQHGAISISRLAKELGTSPPTLTREVNQLEPPVESVNGLIPLEEIPRIRDVIKKFHQNQNSNDTKLPTSLKTPKDLKIKPRVKSCGLPRGAFSTCQELKTAK